MNDKAQNNTVARSALTRSPIIKFFQQQWLLLQVIAYPFRWFRWLIGTAFCIFPLAFVTKKLAENQLVVLPNVADIFLNIAIFFSTISFVLGFVAVFFTLPSHIVHLVTSRQTAFVGLLKKSLYQNLILVTLINAIAIGLAFSLKSLELAAVIKLIILVAFLSSTFIHISIYTAQRTAFGPYLLMVLIPFYQYFAIKLQQVDISWLALGVGLSWFVFTLWWRKWQPHQYRPALFVETFTDPTRMQQLHNGFGQGVFGFFQFGLNRNIENLLDGYLLGRAKSLIKMSLIGLLFPLFFISVMALTVSTMPGATFEDRSRGMLSNSFIFILMFSSQPFSQMMNVFNNIKKSWVLYKGERKNFFFYLERLLLQQTFSQVVVVFVSIYLFLYFLSLDSILIKTYVYAMVSGLVIGVICLYWHFLVYKLFPRSRNMQVLSSAFLVFILALPLGISATVLRERVITEYLNFYLIVLGCLVLAAFLFREMAKRQWQRLEFVRIQ